MLIFVLNMIIIQKEIYSDDSDLILAIETLITVLTKVLVCARKMFKKNFRVIEVIYDFNYCSSRSFQILNRVKLRS